MKIVFDTIIFGSKAQTNVNDIHLWGEFLNMYP